MMYRYRDIDIEGFKFKVLENPSQDITGAFIKAISDPDSSKEVFCMVFKGTDGFATPEDAAASWSALPIDLLTYMQSIPIEVWVLTRTEAEKKVAMLFQDTTS